MSNKVFIAKVRSFFEHALYAAVLTVLNLVSTIMVMAMLRPLWFDRKQYETEFTSSFKECWFNVNMDFNRQLG
jgi:hypothetical protein